MARKVIFLTFATFLTVAVSPVYAIINRGDQPAQLSDIVDVIRAIITLLAPLAAIAFFIMLLVGGYQFLTSGGDPKSVVQARNTLKFAILGVILVVVVWLILTLIAKITGVDITTVSFPPVF